MISPDIINDKNGSGDQTFEFEISAEDSELNLPGETLNISTESLDVINSSGIWIVGSSTGTLRFECQMNVPRLKF